MKRMTVELTRCSWANSSKLEQEYHDTEWGVPCHDDKKLFELLVLESMQAGLSWNTILMKRETLRQGYDNFQPDVIAAYEASDIERLLNDPGVIRHRLKIQATVTNAQKFLEIQSQYGSFSQFIWAYVDHEPRINSWESIADVPAKDELSEKISKELKKLGFKFLGPTTVYSFIQAAGLIDDHLNECFRKSSLS